jgi:mono/diheme cytochrome c family protein
MLFAATPRRPASTAGRLFLVAVLCLKCWKRRLKACFKPAQGNALGIGTTGSNALKGRNDSDVQTRLLIAGLVFVLLNAPLKAAGEVADNAGATGARFFEERVRPILERSCFGCHGPEKQKSGYRLDVRDIAIKGGDTGKPAIVPHNAGASPLIRYVSGKDEEMQMPPAKSEAPRLTAAEVQTLRDWINAGPAWPDSPAGAQLEEKPHWSLQPLAKPPLPGNEGKVIRGAVISHQSGRSQPAGKVPPPVTGSLITDYANSNPIDAFVRARLKEKKLSPSREADRRTLIRRVTCDLTGLPPTPEEVGAFVADKDARAYEKLVDRLLASPRHGERWARHWLDAIHFADSHGYEHDIGRDNAWRFRDYVIEAFNNDTPWPRFIREQLAADVFFPDEPRLTPALGFLGAGLFDLSTFGTATVTFDYIDRDDLVTQTMAAFVSTTANCARCHAHKFDPISQEDYYALQAVFAGVLKGDVAYDEDASIARERKRWKDLIAAAERKDPGVLLAAEHTSLVEQWETKQGHGVRWQPLAVETFLSAEGSTLTRTSNGVFLAGGMRPDKDTYTLTATTGLANITALRLDVLAHDSLPKRGPGRQDNGNLHLSEIELRLFEPGAVDARPLKLKRATADFNQEGWGVERALDGDLKTAWGIYPAVGESHQAVFELTEPQTFKPGARLAIQLKQLHGGGHLIGAFSLAITTDEDAGAAVRPMEVEAALATPQAVRTEVQRVALAAHALKAVASEALARLPAQSVVYAAAPSVDIPSGDPARKTRSLAEPKVVHVLHRGDFDKPREVIGPGALSALKHSPARFVMKDPKHEGERRAALAGWIAHRDNVLTWRSVVNRVWHHHFGRGLCDTPSDFGRMGGTPTHPELLDWLAVWFRDEAQGSLKQLHRLIITSATYRQTSQHRPDAARLDGENRFLWRQNRHRLDADAFRDFTLAVSGALDLRMGGPAVRHFAQAKGPQATPSLDYTGYDWSQPGAGRRSIYRFVWRGIADPLMEAMDFPDLGLLQPVRGFSASSLQSLALYNNDFILHHSAAMAKRVEAEAQTIEEQVNHAVELAWLREPTGRERRDFAAFARAHGLAAFCRLLLNSNEFLFVN